MVGLLVCAGCTDQNSEAAETTPLTQETFPPGTVTPAPGDEIDCGEYTWPIEAQLDDSVEDQFATEHKCFTDALASGTPAVLVEHSFSVEGDPIRIQVRVTGPDQFDLTHDSTLDNFGSQTVDTVPCTGLVITDSQLDPVECEPLGD